MNNWPCSIKEALSMSGIHNTIVFLHPLGPLPDVDPAVFIHVDDVDLEDLGIVSLTLHALSRRISPTPFRFWIESNNGKLATEKTIWNLDGTIDHVIESDKAFVKMAISSFILET